MAPQVPVPAKPRLALVAGLLALGACLCVPETLLAASGRDLTFGYTWRDSASGATIDNTPYDGTFTSTNPVNNSAPQGPINLGFTDPWPYYGQTVTQIWISDNGWISFAAPANSYPAPSATVPNAAVPNGGLLAPFWTDLTADVPIDGDAVRWGRIASTNAFKIQFVGKDATQGGQLVWWDVILYSDGRIKFQYTSPGTVIGNATIGIENQAGNDGIRIASGGTAQPGVVMTSNYVIDFEPPLILPGQCASIPNRGCTSFNGSLPGAGPGNVLYYGCGTSRNEAREAVQAFTLTQPSAVTITLTSARAMRLYLLDACNERQCLRGPGTTITAPLGAGTYYVVVDGALRGDEGAYTLNVTCTPLGSPPLGCPGTASGTTAGGFSFWGTYPCAGARALGGTEATHVVNVATATNLSATLTGGSTDLDVMILTAGPGEITADRCVAFGDATAIAWNAQPGPYLIVVDSDAGRSGPYSLSTDCRIQLDCSALAGTLDFAASRTYDLVGDTTGGVNGVTTYACDPSIVRDGPEDVYELILDAPGMIGVFAYSIDPGISVQIVDTCNEGSCVGTGSDSACGTVLPAGTHYLVVDGTGGAAGAYELIVTFEDPFNRWSVCEDPYGATQLTDTSSAFWNFNDYAFCWDVPSARNYPNGCTFAMYLTANCGTGLHIPLYDSEGGHIRVFDVFRGEYVWLTAVSQGGWFSEGTDIVWQDADCEFGSDPRWNEVVTDVFFERPEGLCGIFRLEFPNHSGFVWELYSNCQGEQRPGFQIHDSLCTALAAYDPLPGVTLVSASGVYNCPDVTVNYTILNNGCVPVENFPVHLYDGATLVHTDIVPRLMAGESQARSFNATFPATPTFRVILQADPLDTVLECTEAPDSSCGASADVDLIILPGCIDTCQVVAQGIATPAAACVGTPITIDASSSSASACPGGTLEYQLTGPAGTIPWQASPIFSGLTPAASTGYFVEVRCAGLTTCTGSRTVNVTVERRPDLPAASVQARDVASCNLGVLVTWSPATFFGTSSTGSYNIYRSEVSCADAVTRPPVRVGLTVTSFQDAATVAGGTYYYVVEAEDAQLNSRCTPPGPRNGGATTRVAANFGTCVMIVDDASVAPDLLPRIGGTLRAGGDYGDGTTRYDETFVEFTWSTSRPIDIPRGEHFHLHRSARPNTGWTRLTSDAPFLQTEAFTDTAADHPDDQTYVWYYVAYVSDGCDNENTATDGGTGG